MKPSATVNHVALLGYLVVQQLGDASDCPSQNSREVQPIPTMILFTLSSRVARLRRVTSRCVQVALDTGGMGTARHPMGRPDRTMLGRADEKR